MPPERTLRRTRLAAILAAIAAAVLWAGCATTIFPPAVTEDPVTVRLLQTARHSALLLPCSGERIVEYGFGEWDWYALNRESWWRAPRILFWPSRGTLGRRELGPRELERLPRAEGVRLFAFAASRRRVEALCERLAREFEAGGQPHYDPQDGLEFVPHTQSFWLAYTCHDAVVTWARELDCSASWAFFRLRLDLAGSR